jgi:hypothetical protein
MAVDAISEANHLMQSSTDADVQRMTDGAALSDRIMEWLKTPQGTLADKPRWGNILHLFKFEPQGPNLEVAIELAIVQKLAEDIDDLVFTGISVEFLEIDLFKVVIRHQFGDTIVEKKL